MVCSLVCRYLSVCPGTEMTVWFTELCVCVTVSLIQQTALDHLLRESRCARAGNTTENRAKQRAERSLQVPPTQALLGRGARARPLITHGSQRAVLTFEGLVSRQGPSNPQQGPPCKAFLTLFLPALITGHPPVGTRGKATDPSMRKCSQGSRSPKKTRKISPNNSRPHWLRLGRLWRKCSVLAPLAALRLVYRGMAETLCICFLLPL